MRVCVCVSVCVCVCVGVRGEGGSSVFMCGALGIYYVYAPRLMAHVPDLAGMCKVVCHKPTGTPVPVKTQLHRDLSFTICTLMWRQTDSQTDRQTYTNMHFIIICINYSSNNLPPYVAIKYVLLLLLLLLLILLLLLLFLLLYYD